MSFLTQSHQVFFRRPLCLILSTSHVIQRLTQSLSSVRSTRPNHLNLLFLIIKLTGSNPKSSLDFFTFLPLIQLNPTHPSDHIHFSAIQLQFLLYFHRPGLIAMHQTTPHTSIVYLAFHGHDGSTINIVLVLLLLLFSFWGYWHQRADERHGKPPPR